MQYVSRQGGSVRTVVVAVFGLTILAAACGGGEDDTKARKEYVDAVVATANRDESLTEEENRCFAEAIVDAVGVDRLKDVVTPEEIREAETSNLVDLGVDVDTGDGEAFYEGVSDCVDLRELLIESQVGESEISAEASTCLDSNLSDDLLKRLMVTGFITSEAELDQDVDLIQEVGNAFQACIPQS